MEQFDIDGNPTVPMPFRDPCMLRSYKGLGRPQHAVPLQRLDARRLVDAVNAHVDQLVDGEVVESMGLQIGDEVRGYAVDTHGD
jgi:hypothetical protein